MMTWRLRKLREICDLQNGFAFKSDLFRDSGYPILRISNIQEEEIETRRVVYFQPKDYKENLDKYRVVNGDLLIAMSGATTGKIGFNTTEQSYYLNQRVGKFEPKDDVLKRFLFYFLLTRVEENLRISAGAAQPNLSTEQIKDFEIPLPPLPEQQRIVNILDKTFEGIAIAKANAEKNLQNARALFGSHLQSVFTQPGPGWVEKPLAELCESSRVITYGVIKLGEEVADGVPCLRTSNVRWFRIETEGMKRIAPALSSEYSRTILKGGEVLVNVRGTLGGVAVVTPEMAGWNVSREVAVVPVNSSRVNPAFLSYLIGSGTSQHWLGSVKKGAAYIGINIEDLRLLPVNTPKMKKQLEVVEHLEALSSETQRLETIYRRKLDALEALKKSLLHQAFAGEL